MAFWGIEVKPGEPYIHQYNDEKGRLRISQATLVAGSLKNRSVVQCNVGDNKPIQLCSLLPRKLETCALNIEFEEDDNVTFSVIGPHTVHLSGFFYGENEDDPDNEYGSNLYGDDVMVSESEDDVIVSDSEDDSSDDDFSLYPAPAQNSGVRIEEIVDEEKPANENGISRHEKKKKGQFSMSNEKENSNRQMVVKTGAGVPILESEDEDGFPKSAHEKNSDFLNSDSKLEETTVDKSGVKSQKKKEKDDTSHVKKSKRKIDADQDGEPARENEPRNPFLQSATIVPENEVKQKKNKNKKKKVAEKEGNTQENGMLNSSTIKFPVVGNDLKATSEKKKENKQQERSTTLNSEKKLINNKGAVVEEQEVEAKSSHIRTFPNGLIIEELAMGRPDGKKASPGKKVGVRYIGKLKKNGKTFDSNVGGAPFKFRLGIGQVIKGWDVGVNGMRVGDKRRLTIPPAMGYGAKGCGPDIPPNSWLVFDVELVDVN